jgi:hypothetical protein
MRRAIAAAVMSGLVLGGALGTPAFAMDHGPGKAAGKAGQAAPGKQRTGTSVKKAKTAAKTGAAKKTNAKKTNAKAGTAKAGTAKAAKAAKTTAAATKTVVFAGYELDVPASWPVYRLDENPRTCVRYDVHAVYLGRPGPDMSCPAGLVGRTESVSVVPGSGAVAGTNAGSASLPAGSGGQALRQLSAVNAPIRQYAVQSELDVALGSGGSGVTVSGTYGTDPAAMKQVLATLRSAPAGAPDSPQWVPAQPPSGNAARSTAMRGQAAAAPAPAAAAQAASSPTYQNWHGVPTTWPVEIVAPTPAPTPTPTTTPTANPVVGGFDACSAPSLSNMKTFRSHYKAVGVYIGGANSACAYGNLSASWIKSAAAMGYGMLPTYVGRQAPCWDGKGALITASQALAQGNNAGADAVADAKSFGLAKGSPIYYDMEAYKGSASCKNAVLAFLGGWDRRVVAGGYVTAVYSSLDSGIVDMQAAAVAKTAGFTAPDAIWIADWDNNATLNVGAVTAWPTSERAKQYVGSVNMTISGVTLNIDKDIVGGPLAR